jgi:hypothetical protein
VLKGSMVFDKCTVSYIQPLLLYYKELFHCPEQYHHLFYVFILLPNSWKLVICVLSL